MDKTIIERFNAFIIPEPNTGCWLWSGGLRHGYGAFGLNSKNVSAHRVSYEINIGPIKKGLFVCHTCDVRSCVNPDHLFLGTHKDNMNDRDKKGRNAYQKGEVNGNAKLTAAQVIEIRKSTLSKIELSKLYGVHKDHIHEIRRGNKWKHLKQPTEEFPTTSFRHEQKHPELYLNKK